MLPWTPMKERNVLEPGLIELLSQPDYAIEWLKYLTLLEKENRQQLIFKSKSISR